MGLEYLPAKLGREQQVTLLRALRAVMDEAPLFTPTMPRSGKPMSVRMTNCGPLGWVTDKERGYRYQATHPVTGRPWPAMPQMLLDLWDEVARYPAPPEACLVNYYDGGAKMGLHQDKDEEDFDAPFYRCRSAIPPSSAPAAARAATRRENSSSSQAMSWCWAEKTGLPFTASTAFLPARPISCPRADGSI